MTARSLARARVRAVVVLWLFRALAALMLAYPLARTVGAFLPPTFPVSDALLFAPGGVYAVEAMRLGGHAVRAALEGSALAFVLLAIATSFPFAVALASLVHPRESLPALARRGAECTPALIALGGAVALAQGVGLVAIAAASNALSGSLDPVLDERHTDLVVLGIAVVATLPIIGLGLVHDLARAGVVRHGLGSVAAAKMAFRKLARATSVVVTSWLSPAVFSVVLVLAAGWAAGALDVSRSGAGRVWAVALLHQATIVGLVVLRLWWLERALSLVDPPSRSGGQPEAALSDRPRALLADIPERSGAPDDPRPDPIA